MPHGPGRIINPWTAAVRRVRLARMTRIKTRKATTGWAAGMVLAVSGAVVLSACAKPPYIHNEAAYNRDHDDFGKVRTDRDEVTVCYHRNATTPREVAQLAEAECRAFGKTAVPRDQDISTCPLTTPVAAHFDCADPQTVRRPGGDSQDFYTRLIQSLPRF